MSLLDLDYDEVNECSEDIDVFANRICSECEEVEPEDLHQKRVEAGFHWYKCVECGHLEEGDE